ncbi:hypothetical protein OSB04_020976 [Centaurea solstitialis]|uniref:Uncharacterized protein n=1 Tax=Centaurea solstitialis TaxID=347529 RepID=A0AA38T120_9ASTR|nr:hypothetical protein OSB04_020976 [Centaurea solstitialis]
MARLGLQMNFQAYDTLLNESIKQKSIRGGQKVHAHMIKTQSCQRVCISSSGSSCHDDQHMVMILGTEKMDINGSSLAVAQSRWA